MPESRSLRLILPVVAMLATALLPALLGFRHPLINTIIYIEIYMILAMGLNIVVGYVGLLDLGYVTFMAIGAVATCMGLMFTKTPGGYVNPPFGQTGIVEGEVVFRFEGAYFLILIGAGLLAAAFGILRGIPTLRLTGDYYAIVTLGIAEIMWQIFKNEDAYTGGAFAIKIQRMHRPLLFGDTFNWASPRFYYIVLGMVIAFVLVMWRLERSRLGRAWSAIRLDETAAKTNGVNVSAYKMIAFALSAFVGGVGGGLYAVWSGNVAVNNLDVWQSILILCALVLGGMGSLRGAVVGGLVLFSLGEILRYQMGRLLGWIPGVSSLPEAFQSFQVPTEARFLFYGIVIILMMRFRPGGLLPRRAISTGLDEASLRQRAADPGPLYHLKS